MYIVYVLKKQENGRNIENELGRAEDMKGAKEIKADWEQVFNPEVYYEPVPKVVIRRAGEDVE